MAKGLERFQQNVFDIFGSGSTIDGKPKMESFLPAIFSKSSAITIQNLTISTSVVDKVPVHEYVVTWTESSDKSIKAPKTVISNAVSPGMASTGLSTAKASRSIIAVGSEVKPKNGKFGKNVKCDGPCQREVLLMNVVQFGCDHLICDDCRKSQKSAILFDGSPGCCHIDCVDLAKVNGEKLRSGPTISSASSATSLNGPFESLQIHVSVLKKVNKNVVKTNFVYEFSSQSRVSSLPKTLFQYIDHIQSCRSYYSFRKPSNRRDLHQISLLDTHIRFYDLMDLHKTYSSDLYVAIIGPGISI